MEAGSLKISKRKLGAGEFHRSGKFLKYLIGNLRYLINSEKESKIHWNYPSFFC